jgi:iron complex outermembrane receptor protein
VLYLLFLLLPLAHAEETNVLESIEVAEEKAETQRIGPHGLMSSRVSSDTASLLGHTPGLSLQTGGGLSSLPVIHGMADDRVNIQVDGASITSSCSNHMNPALSYIDPSKIASLDVWAGISPVRFGGDSIGGSIIVSSKELLFAEASQPIKQSLSLRTFFKSNNENRGASVQASVASQKYYFGYAAFDESAHNYRDGHNRRIKSTLYNQNNQSLTVGRKLESGVLALKFTRAAVPYQGFINQYMDLRDNVSNLTNLSYKGLLGHVGVESTIFHQHTNHLMDVLSSERGGSMPMYTRSDEAGVTVRASFGVSARSLITLGSEYRWYRLDDWWPALPGVTSIMGPGTFESIKDGKRDRVAFFIDTDTNWSNKLSTNIGLRTDLVSMNTGDVKGYNETDNLPADAAAFNDRSHAKKDQNVDLTFLSKFKATSTLDLEFGVARKTRSPNLYERYAWAGTVTDPTNTSNPSSMGASMDMRMINWFGDGNGYVGNIDLKPEVVHKLSASIVGHDEAKKNWELKLTPYVSQIQNFVDADYLGSSMGTNFLRFANHDAIIFGADFSAKAMVLRSPTYGDTKLQTIASYTRGYREDGRADLYHLMPLNGKILLQQTLKKWSGEITTHLVASKKQVNELRSEPVTGAYALLDLGATYQFTSLMRLDLGVSNVFDLTYGLPLGGVDLVNHSPASRTAVVGMGRSINTSLTIEFF